MRCSFPKSKSEAHQMFGLSASRELGTGAHISSLEGCDQQDPKGGKLASQDPVLF